MVDAILVVLLFLLPNFKPTRARFESLIMGETRVASRETHIVRQSTSRFGKNLCGVNRANTEQDTTV